MLQEAEQLDGQPGGRHKVVGVVLQVGVRRRHDLRRGETPARGRRRRGAGGGATAGARVSEAQQVLNRSVLGDRIGVDTKNTR